MIRHLLSGLAAIAIVLVGWRLILQSGGGSSHMKDVKNVHDELTDTLAQIAQGNFNVLLDPGNVGVFNDLANAINDMAKNLGTLETMRQDFITNVSHEIQSPLTSIGGFAELLQKDSLPDNERLKYAAIIEAESSRLSSLSENLLKLSTLDNNKVPLRKQDFRLDKQLEAIALTLEPQWSAKNLTLEADMQKLTICGDEELLSQAWMNLLHNAVKFTPEGGQITINLTSEEGSAVINISDTGIGIAQEDQIHIFERFYKVDKARDRSLGGNGLGLSLVKRIIELHDGKMTVDSEPGKGATFEVALPQ
jgi:signal transduction histidine kinase